MSTTTDHDYFTINGVRYAVIDGLRLHVPDNAPCECDDPWTGADGEEYTLRSLGVGCWWCECATATAEAARRWATMNPAEKIADRWDAALDHFRRHPVPYDPRPRPCWPRYAITPRKWEE